MYLQPTLGLLNGAQTVVPASKTASRDAISVSGNSDQAFHCMQYSLSSRHLTDTLERMQPVVEGRHPEHDELYLAAC